MAKIKLDQGSAEWLNFRKQRIGASEVSTICGVNPYKTPYTLWLEKTGRKDPDPINSFMEYGTKTEPLVRSMIEDQENISLSPAVYVSHCDRFLASLDAVDDKETVIYEIKCPKDETALKWMQANKVPEMYIYQIQFQMFISEIDKAYFVALHNDGLWIKEIKRDAKLINNILYKVEEFWGYIKSDTHPELGANESMVIESVEFDLKAIAFVNLHTESKKVNEALKEARNALLEESDGGPCENDQVMITYREIKGPYDIDKIVKHYNLDLNELENFRKPSVISAYVNVKKPQF